MSQTLLNTGSSDVGVALPVSDVTTHFVIPTAMSRMPMKDRVDSFETRRGTMDPSWGMTSLKELQESAAMAEKRTGTAMMTTRVSKAGANVNMLARDSY